MIPTPGGRDDSDEVAELREAAEQGEAWAQVNLGLMYERGAGGLAKDEAEADLPCSSTNISTTTSTNSPSASIGVDHRPEASCSTALSSRRWPSGPAP